MNSILTIMKKELARFFGDKRLVLSTVIMPGFMVYVIYSFMGSTIMDKFSADENYIPKVYVQNMPGSLQGALESAIPATWEAQDASLDVDAAKQLIQDKELDALVVFPQNFEEQVAEYDVTTGRDAPNVRIYYNSADMGSSAFRSTLADYMDAFEASMANKLDVNAGEEKYDCASDKDMTGQVFSMMLPMLLMIFLFSGCMSVAPESIAGEKERGTIATLLVTPMKRSSLALGKVFSLSIIALLSGISSFTGTFLSLPKLMGGAELGLDSSVYSITDFALLLGIVLSTVLVLVSVISVISAMSKSVKEAGTAVSPLMLLVMFMSLMPMFAGDGSKRLFVFFIPLYNSVNCMNGIFSFAYEPIQVLVTMGVNLITMGVLIYVLTKLFDSEKVMFAR